MNPDFDIRYGDAIDLVKTLPPKSVQSVVTSPPYWGKRVYGEDPREIGREPLGEYCARLAAYFARLRPALRDDATLWINQGDTASGSGGAGGDHSASKATIRKYRQPLPRLTMPVYDERLEVSGHEPADLDKMNWCMAPFEFARHMQAAGFLLRSVIVWDKVQPRPQAIAHARRPLEQHEYVFMFSLGPKYAYNAEAAKAEGLVGDVWSFRSQGRKKRVHAAVYPLELPRRCIVLSTQPGDLVLDPFVGSGTTIEAALMNGRRGVGFELYPEGTLA